MAAGSRKSQRLARFRETFFAECDDLLVTFEERLQLMAKPDPGDEVVQEAYRAVHSIKGGSGVFGLSSVSELSQKMEAVLAQVRNGALTLDQTLLDTMGVAFERLKDFIARSRAEENIEESEWQPVVETLDALMSGQAVADPTRRVGPEEAAATKPAEDGASAQKTAGTQEPAQETAAQETGAQETAAKERAGEPPKAEDDDDDDFGFFSDDDDTGNATPAAVGEEWIIRFLPTPDLLRRGNEPLALLRELADLGELDIAVDTDRLPTLEELDPEVCYLGWTLTLRTTKSRDDVAEVFEFAEDDCDLTITRKAEAETPSPPAAEPAPAATAPAPETVPATTAPPVGALPAVFAEPPVAPDQFADLVSLVGELVLSQADLEKRLADPQRGSETGVTLEMANLGLRLGQLQEKITALSMLPLNALAEMVEDHLGAIGPGVDPSVRLDWRGDTARVDRQSIQRITGPLRDLVRNLVHGRLTGSMPAAEEHRPATLSLAASQHQGHVTVRLRFDGRYLEPTTFFRHAAMADHVREAEDAPAVQSGDWIFDAGVWDLPPSGDGGADADMATLRQRIEAMGGRLVASVSRSAGLVLDLRLPAERAVLDAMVISHGETRIALPVNRVLAMFKPEIKEAQGGDGPPPMIDFRGEFIPLIVPDRLFGVSGGASNGDLGLAVAVETLDRRTVALLADQALGRRSLSVMNISANMGEVTGIAGALALENGELALILDTMALTASGPMSVLPDLAVQGTVPAKTGMANALELGGRVMALPVAGEWYGVGLGAVHQILDRRRVTPLPGGAKGILGLIRWNEMLVPVMNLGHDGAGATPPIEPAMLVVIGAEDRYLALPVDGRPELLNQSESTLQQVPEAALAVRGELLTGMVRMDGRPVAMIDTNRLFRILTW